MKIKRCERFHYLIMTDGTVSRQSFIPVLHTSSWTMLKFIGMLNLIEIYHVVHESWALSLTDHGRMTGWSAKPRPSKKSITHVSCLAMLTCISMHDMSKIYYAVQGLWKFSLTGDGRTDVFTQWLYCTPVGHAHIEQIVRAVLLWFGKG